MEIYADTNIYARPFDDYSQPRIFLEGEAALLIFKAISQKRFSLITSDILKLEIERTLEPKRIQMKSFLELSGKHIFQSKKVLNAARKILKTCKIPPRDAIHLASAKIGKVKYFLTCDNDILKKDYCLEKYFCLKVANPLQFILLKKL